MAIDPTELVRAVSDGAHEPPGPAPALLRHPVRSSTRTPALREGDALRNVHREWAALATGAHPTADSEPGLDADLGPTQQIVLGGRRLAGRIARRLGAPARSDQIAVLARVVQALDAVASRCDELANRLDDLEAAVEEIVRVASEDLVQIRAAVTTAQKRTVPDPDE